MALVVGLFKVNHDELGRVRSIDGLRGQCDAFAHRQMVLVIVEPNVGILILYLDIASRPMIREYSFALFLGSNPYGLSSIESAINLCLRIAKRKDDSIFSINKRVCYDAMMIGIETCC